jgi:hypothetical protein
VRREPVEGHTTYTYQLRAFVAAVRGEQPMAAAGSDGILNMRIEQDTVRKFNRKANVGELANGGDAVMARDRIPSLQEVTAQRSVYGPEWAAENRHGW